MYVCLCSIFTASHELNLMTFKLFVHFAVIKQILAQNCPFADFATFCLADFFSITELFLRGLLF